MPVAKGPQISPRSVLILGFTVMTIAGLLVLMVWLVTSQSDTQIVLGDRDFNAGDIDAIRQEIDDHGPILYSDVGAGGQRDIIVTYRVTGAELEWLAFSARREGDPRDCYFSWDDRAGQFLLTSAPSSSTDCEEVTADAVGTGLRHYRVEIRDDNIHVLLNEYPE